MERRTTFIILTTLSMAVFGLAGAQAHNFSNRHRAQEIQLAQIHLLAQVEKKEHQKDPPLLPGNRTVFGKIEAVTSEQIKVDIGEIQPRFLPLRQAKQKKFPVLKAGDDLVIIVNEQNLMVDYHPLDYPSANHKILRGMIASNMPIGHDRVVIKGTDGTEQSFKVRSQVRSKLASIPVGISAIFLIDETSYVADATFAGVSAAKEAHQNPEDKSPIKGANRQVDGIVGEPLRADRITLRTGDGERSFEVREAMIETTSKLHSGDSVILLMDNDDKVVDIAVPPQKSR